MKIVILSTETLHHAYFINKLFEHVDISAVFYETEHVNFPFDTSSPFSKDEERFENKMFFKKKYRHLPDNLKLFKVKNINAVKCIDMITKYSPDIGISFGTGKISSNIFSLFKQGVINVHRGIVTRYRGLDSDLWAIYHNDFNNIGVTIHFVEENLDKGMVLKMDRIKFSKEDRIFHLRYKTTLLAKDMVLEILESFEEYNKKALPQKEAGRYYSAMPSVLKPVCRNKFTRFIKDSYLFKENI